MVLRKASRLAGLDRPVAYSSLRQLWGVLSGPLILVLVVAYLDEFEQGYYYVFYSLIGLRMLFDLGFGQVTTQLICHEMAVSADKPKLQRYITFSLKLYLILGLLFLLVLIFGGNYFFGKTENSENLQVSWRNAWMLTSLGALVGFWATSLSAIAKGFGKIAEASLIDFICAVILTLTLAGALIVGLGLFSTGLALLLSSFASIFSYLVLLRGEFRNVYKAPAVERYDLTFLREILPFQSKVACSLFAGYLRNNGLQLFAFRALGPVTSGQLGFSLAIGLLVVNLSQNWMHTRAPLFGRLVALSDFKGHLFLFRRTCIQMLLVCIALLLVLYLSVLIICSMQQFEDIEGRMLDVWALLLLFILISSRVFYVAMNVLGRSFKEEWLYLVGLANSALYIAVISYSIEGGLANTLKSLICLQYLVFIPIAIYIVIKKYRSKLKYEKT